MTGLKTVFNQFYSFVWKDQRLLQLIFTIFASYLIFEEFHIFFFVRPTYTSDAKRKMRPEDFPEIILCPEPSIDINALRSRGYLNTVGYFRGTGDIMVTIFSFLFFKRT